MKKSNDKKGYWVAKANVNSPEKQQNYGKLAEAVLEKFKGCLLYTSPSPRDNRVSRMPSSA